MNQINSMITGETRGVSSYAINLLESKYSSFQTKKFRKNVAKVLAKGFEKEEKEYAKADYMKDIRDEMPNIIPDGYIIDEKEHKITVFEVEDSNLLTAYKIDCIVELWSMLDCESWKFEAKVTDRYGMNEKTLPLMHYYYSSLKKDSDKRKKMKKI